jgi:hypothetical protein
VELPELQRGECCGRRRETRGEEGTVAREARGWVRCCASEARAEEAGPETGRHRVVVRVVSDGGGAWREGVCMRRTRLTWHALRRPWRQWIERHVMTSPRPLFPDIVTGPRWLLCSAFTIQTQAL